VTQLPEDAADDDSDGPGVVDNRARMFHSCASISI
jgi:hypothetical protein